MDVSARMFPAKSVFVPSIAELPIRQKVLHDCAPLISFTLELLAVVRVLPVLKMKTLLLLPCPSNVRLPVNWAEGDTRPRGP